MALYEVAIDQSISGSSRPCVNIFHVNAADGTFPQAITDTVRGQWNTHIRPYQSSAWGMDRVRCRTLDGVSYAETIGAMNGGIASAGAPPQVAALVRKVAPGLPRRRYGRLFLAGLARDRVEGGGNLDGSFRSDLNSSFNNWLAALDTAGHPMVQVSWQLVGGEKTVGPIFEVTSLSVQQKVATQRRRVRD